MLSVDNNIYFRWKSRICLLVTHVPSIRPVGRAGEARSPGRPMPSDLDLAPIRLRPGPGTARRGPTGADGSPGKPETSGKPCRMGAWDGRGRAEYGNPPIAAPSEDSIQL